jgi:hypothetical protein
MSEKKKKATKEVSASADPLAEYQNKLTITFQEGLCYFLSSLFVAATPVCMCILCIENTVVEILQGSVSFTSNIFSRIFLDA